jgi:hypothetical protein
MGLGKARDFKNQGGLMKKLEGKVPTVVLTKDEFLALCVKAEKVRRMKKELYSSVHECLGEIEAFIKEGGDIDSITLDPDKEEKWQALIKEVQSAKT